MRYFVFEFDFSSVYVNPMFPKEGERVEYRVLAEGLIDGIVLRAENYMGLWDVFDMERCGKYFKTSAPTLIKGEHQHFYFEIFSEGEVYYFGLNGISTCYPNKKDCFEMISGLTVPKWISGSVCYQIFPDRFCNGDRSNNVKDKAYEFDGGTVNTHTFDEIPEEFEKSRCLDFFNGDLKGIESKLKYLKKLGITCLYLNPINSSLTVHRYDSINFFKVDEKLGGDEALISLIDKAHKMGIKVVVDISINHTGSNHPWFLKAKEDPKCEESSYYYKEGDDFRYWAGVTTLPQLNYNSQKLRDLIYRSPDSAMKKYLKAPFCQDGWRLDVAPELGRTEKQTLTKEVWREVNKELKGLDPNIYLVGEDWNDATDYLQGDMWDGTMNYFGSGRPLRRWMGEVDRFLVGGWGHDPGVTRPYTGDEMVDSFQNGIKAIPDQMRYFQMNLIDSHDTPRLQNHKEIWDKEIYKGVMLALYMLPGLPNIYYGNEINLAGRMGTVEGSRYPMCWDESKWDKDLLSHFTFLGKLREKYKEQLSFGATKFLPLSECTFAIYRYTDEKGVLAIINRDSEPSVVELESILFEDKTPTFIYGRGKVEMSDLYEVSLNAKESVVLLFS